MPDVSKESIVLTLINILLSASASILGSVKDVPLGTVAGLTVVFIFIAILGAASGTIVALQNFTRFWIVSLILSGLAVAALIYYSRLLALGGLAPFQVCLAGFLFFYIFFVFFFLFTYLEKLIRRVLIQAR